MIAMFRADQERVGYFRIDRLVNAIATDLDLDPLNHN